MRNKFFSLQTLKVLFYLSFLVLRLRKIIVLTPIILLFPVIKFRFIHCVLYPVCLSINIATTYPYCTCEHFYGNISYVEISRECKRQLGVRFGFCQWIRIIIFIHCIFWKSFFSIESLSRSGSRQWLVGNVLWNVKQELTCTECNFCLNIIDIVDSYQSISQ